MRSSTARPARIANRALLAGVAVAVLVAAPGCGGNSKPAYCSDRTQLQKSVENLKGAVADGGLSGLRLQLTTVRTDATTLAEDAKSDFPTETTALDSSLDALIAAVKALPDSPSAPQIAGLALGVSAVVNDAKRLSKAITSACD